MKTKSQRLPWQTDVDEAKANKEAKNIVRLFRKRAIANFQDYIARLNAAMPHTLAATRGDHSLNQAIVELSAKSRDFEQKVLRDLRSDKLIKEAERWMERYLLYGFKNAGPCPRFIRHVIDIENYWKGTRKNIHKDQYFCQCVEKAVAERAKELLSSTPTNKTKGQQKPCSPKRFHTLAEDKIIAVLTKHHKYEDDSIINPEPIRLTTLAARANVGKATASAFFKKHCRSYRQYAMACRSDDLLINTIKLLRGEVYPEKLYGSTPPTPTGGKHRRGRRPGEGHRDDGD